jgi:type VI protein secretion system component VasK
MSAFVYEIANVHAAVTKAYPSDPKGLYAVPFYLIVGEPGAGRSTAVHSMNLTWNAGEGPLKLGMPEQLCTYWMPNEAIFIEPEGTVLGPKRNPDHLKELCDELRRSRPREPVDGILLVISIAEFIDLDEAGQEAFANRLRKYLVEIGRSLHADVPVYAALTRYDTMWGFAEVFGWTPERKREEPWGFTLPPDTPIQQIPARIAQELVGLNARFEAFCLAKLSSEDPPEHRIKAFQHLAEIRVLAERLRQLFTVLAMANAFERAPWFRSVIIGSAIPGTGDRLRAGVTRFFNMGLGQAQTGPGSSRPGGLPIHAFMNMVVLPERDIVPLRTRWRDDTLVLLGFIFGIVLALGAVAAAVLFALAR